jgi:osmotically-inducible protein OsmY
MMALLSEKRYVLRSDSRVEFSPRSEKEMMENRAASRLKRSPYPEVRRIVCEFHEGVLTLRGHVSSFYLKQLAQTAILGMDGVGELNNQLEVETPPDGP